MPVGPMSLLCIQRALVFGALAGFTTGLGAATVLAIYTACAVLGLGPAIISALVYSKAIVPAVSACLLLWFSARILGRTVSLAGPTADGHSAISSYCSAVACALFNPLTPVLLAAVLPTVALPEPRAASTMVAAVFAASVTWWLVVSGSVAALRSSLSVTVLNLINKASGLVLGALGILMAAECF
ncbi:LysE family translocator [Microvirga terricola]|nr:LysE family transporter [Microvirga terricola]